MTSGCDPLKVQVESFKRPSVLSIMMLRTTRGFEFDQACATAAVGKSFCLASANKRHTQEVGSSHRVPVLSLLLICLHPTLLVK